MASLTGKGFSFIAMPNPYFGATTISLTLSQDAEVKLELISVLGQVVGVLENGLKSEGAYTFEFSSSKYGLNKGVYTIRLSVDGETSFIKLLELE
ncbi:MAG: T9SS type A sorting domain-containing protein [Bacteroidetes bacterium]|nr:T9SS type A sorting domain-containing protein [Bacteroidota bacterium]